MAVLTTEAQVNAQLRAMRAESFELLLLVLDEGREGSMLTLTADRILARLSWLKARNANGVNVNIRPKSSHLVLLDDLATRQIEKMRENGFQPSVVVETSPDNFQAWLDCGEDLSDEEATAMAQLLARRFQSDVRAAGRRHAGRLAGFTNRKPNRRLPNGLYPFVRLHHATAGVFRHAAALRDEARQQIEAKAKQPAAPVPAVPFWTSRSKLKSIVDFHNDVRYGGDLSRADYAFAIYAHSHGLSDSEIVDAILARDMRKKGNAAAQKRYALYTVRRARRNAVPPA
jgi:hypothetical protein